MFRTFFSSPTFQDHAGQPSFGRKATFWILLFAGLIAVSALALVAIFDPSKVSTMALGIVGWCATIVSIVYAAAQGSKATSHLNNPSVPVAPKPVAQVPRVTLDIKQPGTAQHATGVGDGRG